MKNFAKKLELLTLRLMIMRLVDIWFTILTNFKNGGDSHFVVYLLFFKHNIGI